MILEVQTIHKFSEIMFRTERLSLDVQPRRWLPTFHYRYSDLMSVIYPTYATEDV